MKMLSVLLGLWLSAHATQPHADYTILIKAEVDVAGRDDVWTKITDLVRGQGTGYAQSRGDRLTINLTPATAEVVRAWPEVYSLDVDRAIAATERKAYLVSLDPRRGDAERTDLAERIWRLASVEGDTSFRARPRVVIVELLPTTAAFVRTMPGVVAVHEDVQFGTCAPGLE